MGLKFVHQGEHRNDISTLAVIFGAQFSDEEISGKDEISFVEQHEYSIEGPFKEQVNVPLGFRSGIEENFKKKWKMNIKISESDKIVIAFNGEDENYPGILEWTLWYLLEAWADKKIGRIWF